jgi:hypothetical protein
MILITIITIIIIVMLIIMMSIMVTIIIILVIIITHCYMPALCRARLQAMQSCTSSMTTLHMIPFSARSGTFIAGP